jgi:hypothetical protein
MFKTFHNEENIGFIKFRDWKSSIRALDRSDNTLREKRKINEFERRMDEFERSMVSNQVARSKETFL